MTSSLTSYNVASAPNNLASGPLFVVGIWRSGTSLLYTLLNQHPDVGLMYESEVALMWPLFLHNRAKHDWIARWEFWNQAITRHGLQSHTIPGNIANVVQASEHVCREYARRQGAQIWGCKSPAYYRYLPQLARDFSNARFIIIWRNPVAICRSILHAAGGSRYFRRRGMFLRALLGCAELKRGCDELLRRGFPVHQLQYEDLIRDPERQMRLICEFLHIPFHPGMMSLDDADRSAIYGDDHHSLVKGKQIIRAVERNNPLQPAQERKIHRYVHWWRKQAQDWPVCFRANANVKGPSRFERLVDAFFFGLFTVYDEAVLLIYAFFPMTWLRAYRSCRKGRNTPVTARQQSALQR